VSQNHFGLLNQQHHLLASEQQLPQENFLTHPQNPQMNNASPTNLVAASPLRTTNFNSGSQAVQDDELYQSGQHFREQGEDNFSEKEYSHYD
jgi:hypothetical protein